MIATVTTYAVPISFVAVCFLLVYLYGRSHSSPMPVPGNVPFIAEDTVTATNVNATNKSQTIGVAEAYAYLKKDSQWRLDQNEPGTNSAELEVTFSAIHELERAARDGEITISGIKGGKGMHEEIPAPYWRNAFIDSSPLARSSPVAIARPKPHMTGAPEFADLIVPQDQVVKAWPAAPKVFKPATPPQSAATKKSPSDLAREKYFLKPPHNNLADALREAKARNMPIFLVIYDESNAQQSRLSHCLMWFLDYNSNKKLLQDYFVSALVASSNFDVREFVPSDDPLERARRVVLTPSKKILTNMPVIANPDAALEEIRADIQKWEKENS